MSYTVDVSLLSDTKCPFSCEEIESICSFVLSEEHVKRDCFVSVSVVTDEHIKEVNREWRGRDAATDVISLECERPDDEQLADGEPCELGDILLAPGYIARQALRFGTTAEDEFCLMLVHGMLHLLGYDHLEEGQAQVMEKREDELVLLLRPHSNLGSTKLTRHREDDAL